MAATKEKQGKSEAQHATVLPEDVIAALLSLPDAVDKMMHDFEDLNKEVSEIREVQEQIDRRTTASALKKTMKEGVEEIAQDDELEHEIEELEGGPIRRTIQRAVNLLPQGKRERGQFVAGFVLGSATSNIVAPVGIIAASIARGRVIISS